MTYESIKSAPASSSNPMGRLMKEALTTISSVPEPHPSSQRFEAVLDELRSLHRAKSKDYGRVNDPFANVRASQEFGISPWVGTMLRLNDKVKRLQSLAENGSLKNEGAIDSFMDIACYAIIALCLYEEECA